MRNALRKFAEKLNVGMDRITPDSFIFAVALTVVVYLMGIIAGNGPFQMIKFWAEGFWNFLLFGMQMVLVLVTGFTLATTRIGQKGLAVIARIPKNSAQATVFILIASAVLGYISWGLGLVGAAVLARELAKNLRKVNFKLLVAGGYTGAMIGTMGLSFSEALLVNTPGHFLEDTIGLIPYSQTTFSPMILIPTILAGVVVLPIIFWAIHPDEKDVEEMDADLLAKFEEDSKMSDDDGLPHDRKPTIAERMDNSPVVNVVISIMGLSYVVYWFATEGFNLTLNIFNFTLLFLGILLHWTPKRLLTAFEEGVKASYGVVLQFPFYAGIQGMMGGSGLVTIIANWFLSISTAATFPVFTYISAAIVNFFIPSSGGIFMIQGPVMMEAGMALGVPAATIVNSFSAGEVISNLVQPFWAIPLLGLAGLKMKDIVGYCILSFLIASILYIAAFLIF
jgi:short-chain fatty acids transporter